MAETGIVNSLEIHTDWNGSCPKWGWGRPTVRNIVLAVLSVLIVLAGNSYAAPQVMRAAAVPEPGVLVALGGGLVGLATLVRYKLNR